MQRKRNSTRGNSAGDCDTSASVTWNSSVPTWSVYLQCWKNSSYSWACFQNLHLRKVQKLGCWFVLLKVKTWISSAAINALCAEDKSMWVNPECLLLFRTKMLWFPQVPPPAESHSLSKILCLNRLMTDFNCHDLVLSKCQRSSLESFYCSLSSIFCYLVDFSNT